MLVFLTLGLYSLTLLVIGILRLTRRSFAYAWLTAALGTLLAWVSVFAWQIDLNALVFENIWQPADLFPVYPAMVVDEISWVYALSLSALALAVILTAPAQSTGLSASAWAGTLGLTVAGISSFVAANPLTLVMIWAGLDLLELLNTLRLADKPNLSERAVIAFTMRSLGTGFALWAIVTNGAELPSFEAISSQSALFLFLAVGLRLGVLPLHLTYRSEPALRRGMGTVLRLAVAASSLVLLARIPVGLLETQATLVLQVFLSLALLYAAWKWLRAPGELSGRPYWMIGLGALSLLAALRGNPIGSAAWGAALVLHGGLVFLYASRQRRLTLTISATMVAFLSLPFTLTASAWQGQSAFEWVFWPFMVAGQVLLALGFARHLWRSSESELQNMPRWAQSAYPLGFFALAATILLLGLWGWAGALQVGFWPVGLAVGLISALILAAWWRINRLGMPPTPFPERDIKKSFPDNHASAFYESLASLIWNLYRSLRRLIDFLSGLLEGDGGLLWTVLVLVLLLILFQSA